MKKFLVALVAFVPAGNSCPRIRQSGRFQNHN